MRMMRCHLRTIRIFGVASRVTVRPTVVAGRGPGLSRPRRPARCPRHLRSCRQEVFLSGRHPAARQASLKRSICSLTQFETVSPGRSPASVPMTLLWTNCMICARGTRARGRATSRGGGAAAAAGSSSYLSEASTSSVASSRTGSGIGRGFGGTRGGGRSRGVR